MKNAVMISIVLAISLCGWLCRQKPAPENDVFEEYLLCIFSDTFGYTLVDAKPASLDDSWTSHMKKLFPKEVDRANFFLNEVFSRSDKFIFREINGWLWLINKQEMSNQIQKYPGLRLFISKKFGTKEKFFGKLRNENANLFDLLDYKVDLIAIVFGYGLDNGKFYIRRGLVGKYLQKYPIVQFYPFDGFPFADKVRGMGWLFCRYLKEVKVPPINPRFSSLNAEWEWIKNNEWVLYVDSRPEPPYYLRLPAYISCKSREAKKVHKRFVRARAKLAKLFCSKKPSEVIAQEVLSAETSSPVH
jgi:hypothetical protein